MPAIASFGGAGRLDQLDQAQPPEARMAFLSDNDVVVNDDAERLTGSHDLLGHFDIGPGGRGIA